MAASHSIRLPFTEKALDQAVRDHHEEGSELFLYDRSGPKSVGGLVLWVNHQGAQTYQILKKIKGRKYRRNLGSRSIL